LSDDIASKNPDKTRGRPFEPGNPGGPGRPTGSRNKATLVLDALAEGNAQAVLGKQLELAKQGDQRAAELVLARVWPVRKGRPVAINMPKVDRPADIVAALGTVADAVGAGKITPDEGAAVASILEGKRRAIESMDLEARIAALENRRT